ncbi:acyltransferase family protein [Microbacterium sp. GXF7504]
MSAPGPARAGSAPRRDIQGLRAVAVVAVVLCHALGLPAGGFAGVDVFFVVSGFVITASLLRDVAQHGRVRLGSFYGARVRRILPVAVLAIAVVTAVGFAVFNGPRAWQTLQDAGWAAVFAMNWHLALEGTDYFAASGAESPLQHLWTLSVEEQFYLVWPLLVVLLVAALPAAARSGRRARVVVGAGALAVAAASFAWGAVQTAAAPEVAYFSTATRAWELALGAVLAAAAPVLARIPRPIGGALGWVGTAGVVAAFLMLDPASPMPVPAAVLPTAAAALVLAGGVAGDPRHRHLFVLTNPVSTFIGDMSYSLYVWHFPVLVFAAVLLPPGTATTLLVLAVVAVVSLVSYFAVEQPLHRSPWLRPVDESPAPRDVVEPAIAAAPAPERMLPSTRPAGWQPGRRYFPGAPASTVPGLSPQPAALEAAAPEPAAPETAAPRPQAPAVEAPEPVDAPARRDAWAAWRARYAPRAGGALLGLVAAAGAVVLVLQSVLGVPVLPRIDPLAAPPAADTDAMATLQAELADAATATAWPDLTPSMESVLDTGSGDNPAHDCFSPEVEPELAACTWGAADAPRHLYLVGDSTAMAYAPAFRAIADASGGALRITTVGLYGCRFTDVLVENGGAGVMAACQARKDLVAAAIQADAPDAVVVSNAFTLGHTVAGQDLAAADLAAAARNEAARYGLPGRIVFLTPPPESVSPQVCFSPATGPASCLSGIDETWRAMAAATAEDAGAVGERYVDAVGLVCWEGVCPGFAGGIPVRYDQTHLTVAYAEHVAPALREALTAAGVL